MVIKYNLDVIRTADWIIDLRPEGGEDGGYIVAEGTPEEVTVLKAITTGQFFRDVSGVTNRWELKTDLT